MTHDRTVIILSSLCGGAFLGYALAAVDGAILGAIAGFVVGLADWNE